MLPQPEFTFAVLDCLWQVQLQPLQLPDVFAQIRGEMLRPVATSQDCRRMDLIAAVLPAMICPLIRYIENCSSTTIIDQNRSGLTRRTRDCILWDCFKT